MSKSAYTTKDIKDSFIKWLLSKYGYINTVEDVNKLPNPRELSDEFYKVKGVRIPKLTIYRWLKNMKPIIAEYNNIGVEYINFLFRSSN